MHIKLKKHRNCIRYISYSKVKSAYCLQTPIICNLQRKRGGGGDISYRGAWSCVFTAISKFSSAAKKSLGNVLVTKTSVRCRRHSLVACFKCVSSVRDHVIRIALIGVEHHEHVRSLHVVDVRVVQVAERSTGIEWRRPNAAIEASRVAVDEHASHEHDGLLRRRKPIAVHSVGGKVGAVAARDAVRPAAHLPVEVLSNDRRHHVWIRRAVEQLFLDQLWRTSETMFELSALSVAFTRIK